MSGSCKTSQKIVMCWLGKQNVFGTFVTPTIFKLRISRLQKSHRRKKIALWVHKSSKTLFFWKYGTPPSRNADQSSSVCPLPHCVMQHLNGPDRIIHNLARRQTHSFDHFPHSRNWNFIRKKYKKRLTLGFRGDMC